MLNKNVEKAIRVSGFLRRPGAWVLVDGQFGSTGKGLAASVLAEACQGLVDIVTSNAGPNSGHTFYGPDGEKIVLRQLPSFAVAHNIFHKGCLAPRIQLNSGAVIDPRVLEEEVQLLGPLSCQVQVDPFAAIADEEAKALEAHLNSAIGSTAKGTGGAIARKILRDPKGVVGGQKILPPFMVGQWTHQRSSTILVEVSQGFSLGIDAGFYPHSTSRNCTVAQAMSDAKLHPEDFAGAMMVVRTFPIRVAGNSGTGYPDQEETSWQRVGVEPEYTTVTNKERRVFTWSDMQFQAALRANRPTALFINFMNYLPLAEREPFVKRLKRIYYDTLQRRPTLILLGHGPHNKDTETVSI